MMKSCKSHAPEYSGLTACDEGSGNGRWCLPSGIGLSEFALQAGFLAPRLWHASGSFARNDQAAWLAPFRPSRLQSDTQGDGRRKLAAHPGDF